MGSLRRELSTAGLVNISRTFDSVSAGNSSTCAVTTAGELYCWGLNHTGQLGNGSTTNTATPLLVNGSLPFASISMGNEHACGVTGDGVPHCWGSNRYGQLGNGSTTNTATPLPVTPP